MAGVSEVPLGNSCTENLGYHVAKELAMIETQRQNLQTGKPVRLAVSDFGMDCVLVRADVYQCQQAMQDVAALIDRNMREDDANDPLLQSYQDVQP